MAYDDGYRSGYDGGYRVGYDAMSATIEEATKIIAASTKQLALLQALYFALVDARDYIDGQIDVIDGDYGIPEPNRAMSLAMEWDELIARAEQALEIKT